MPSSPILGTAYTARSKDLSFQRMINLYLESVDGLAKGAAPAGLMGCPGLDLEFTLGGGPVRAAYVHNDYAYFVSGSTAYRVDNAFNILILGTLPTSSGAAYIIANLTQVAFFDQASAHVWDTGGTFSAVTLPYSGLVGVPTYQDTFALLTRPGTLQVFQSAENDFTSWDPTAFTTEDGNAQNVVGCAALQDHVCILKERSLCFFVNAGNPGFAYIREPGVYPEVGLAAPKSLFRMGDTLYWVGVSQQGTARIYQLVRGYEPQPISTYAIEFAMGGYQTVADAIAFGYGQEGHNFAVFSFPSGNQTWVFDPKETELHGQPVWHERAGFSNGTFTQYAGSCAISFAGFVLMGDRTNGNVYILNINSHTDNGSPRKWLRSWLATGQAKHMAEKVNWLNVQMSTGSDVAAGTNPLMMFRQSLDSGANWSAERFIPAGMTGQKMLDVNITRLGATRRALNSNRVFELSSTDSFRPELLGAEIG